MITSAATAGSASHRPLGLRMRTDLVLSEQRYGLARRWTVKDPLTLQYVQLRDEEFSILRLLDGRISLEELRIRYEAAHAPKRLPAAQLQSFLRRLHQQGLVVADAAGQARPLLERRRQKRRRAVLSALAGVLSIRFRGLDPERWLQRIYPACRWLFAPATVVVAVLLIVSAGLLAAVHSDDLASRLPGFSTFFSARNVVWLAAILATTKVVHELGHALTLKHFGGECHELGLMLLVFTPCLYCNVTDAWMLPSKWRRIAVAAAGIWVELALAAAALWLWWFSHPGLFHRLCLNVVVLCSVSTVLFNGNPLLKYDGYYVLSDLVGVPNLRQQSSAALRRLLARICLGLSDATGSGRLDGRPAWLVAYAVVSGVYRWVLVAAVLWLLHMTLEPYGLDVLVVVLGMLVLFGMLAAPAVQAARFVTGAARRRQVNRGRLALTAAVLIAVGLAFCFLPLPRSTAGPAVVEPHAAQPVYVTVPGQLTEIVALGRAVDTGDVLARLSNPRLDLEVEQLAGERTVQAERLANLEARRSDDPAAAAAIPAARAALTDLDDRLGKRREDQRRLVLTAPVPGTVLPPPNIPHRTPPPGELGSWSGTPFDDRNADAWVDESLFCLIGDPSSLEVIVILDESAVEHVRAGEAATVRLDQTPGADLTGRVAEVAKIDLQVTPRELADGREIAVRRDEYGVSRPLDVYYQARIALDPHRQPVLMGARGRARIEVQAEPLGGRLLRFLQQTFRFRL